MWPRTTMHLSKSCAAVRACATSRHCRRVQPVRMSSHFRFPRSRKYLESYWKDSRFRIGNPPIVIGTLPASGFRAFFALSASKKPAPIEWTSADRSKRWVPLAVRRRSASLALAFNRRSAFALEVGNSDPRYDAIVAWDPAASYHFTAVTPRIPTMIQVADYQGLNSPREVGDVGVAVKKSVASIVRDALLPPTVAYSTM
jgi:hypothetical protein